MKSNVTPEQAKKFKTLIITLSIVLPLAIAALFGIRIDGVDTSFLPPIYASINGLTAILLIAAIVSIKNGNRKRHEALIKTAMGCSVSFILMYVAYHITSDSTEYGSNGFDKYIYYFILISHIALSVVVIPFVLFTYYRAWLGNFQSHKKLARYAFPLWLYVAITGVIVYLMISPYYA